MRDFNEDEIQSNSLRFKVASVPYADYLAKRWEERKAVMQSQCFPSGNARDMYERWNFPVDDAGENG